MFDFIKTILQRKDVYNQGNDIIQEEDMFVPSSYLDGIYTQTKEDAVFNNRILNIMQSDWDDGGIYSKDYATSMILKTNNFQMRSGNISNKTNFFILDSDTIKATSYTENNDVFYTLNTIPLKAGVGIDITDNTINFTGDITTEIVVAKPNEFIVDYLEENMDNAIFQLGQVL